MKRCIAFLAGICLFSFQLVAQKFDKEWFLYQNTHIPAKLIYDQVKSYGINIINNSSGGFTMDYGFADKLSTVLSSYEKTDYSKADMPVTITYGPYIFVSEKTSSVTREEEINKQKTNVTYYKRVLTFKYPISYKAVNAKNNTTLYFNEFSSNNIRTIETSEFKSEGEATEYFNKNRTAYISGHINDLAQNFMKGVNGSMKDNFDFYSNQVNMEMYHIKKWDKDDEYNGHLKTVEAAFKTQTADESPVIVKEKIKADIEYLQNWEGKFNPKDKKEDILFFCNYYNLATIHYCLDDFEKAEFYVQKLDSSDKNEAATKNLKSFIKIASARNNRHFLSTTHLNYNPVKDYRLDGKAFTSDAASATENIASSILSGQVTAADKVTLTDNTELTGKIVFNKEKNELQIVTKENPDKPTTLTTLNCQKFNIDTVNYIVLKNSSGSTPVKQFFKILYSSAKIMLVQYVDNSFIPNPGYIGSIRPKEESVFLFVGLGIKKKVANYFEDCPVISEKAKDGDYGGGFSNPSIGKYLQLCAEYDACK